MEANDSGAVMVARLKGDESAVHQAEMLVNTRLNYIPPPPKILAVSFSTVTVKHVAFSLE